MANQPFEVPYDAATAEEVTVSAFKDSPPMAIGDDVSFNMETFRSQNLLRSCRYAMWLTSAPKVLRNSYLDRDLQRFTLLTESIEFPGKTVNSVDYRIAGKQKIKVPSFREYSEISITFYHSVDFPMYQFFSDWTDAISPNSANNSYFDDLITPEIRLMQYTDDAALFSNNNKTAVSTRLDKMFAVKLLNAYPLNFTSMPSTWADDGFQRLTATFFYEKYEFIDLRTQTQKLNSDAGFDEFQISSPIFSDISAPDFPPINVNWG